MCYWLMFVYIYAHVEGVSPFPCYERPVLPAPTPKPTPVSVLARSVYLLLVNISLRSASQPGYREERERALHTPTFRGKYQASAGINHWLWLAAWWRCSVSLSLSPSPTSASPPPTCAISIISIKVSPSGVAEEQTGWLADIWAFDSLLHDLGRVEQKSSVCYSGFRRKVSGDHGCCGGTGAPDDGGKAKRAWKWSNGLSW